MQTRVGLKYGQPGSRLSQDLQHIGAEFAPVQDADHAHCRQGKGQRRDEPAAEHGTDDAHDDVEHDALLAVGRREEAREWFARAAEVDALAVQAAFSPVPSGATQWYATSAAISSDGSGKVEGEIATFAYITDSALQARVIMYSMVDGSVLADYTSPANTALQTYATVRASDALGNARFVASPIPVLLHIASVTIYSLLGAFQFSAGLRRRWPGWHRAEGRNQSGQVCLARLPRWEPLC